MTKTPLSDLEIAEKTQLRSDMFHQVIVRVSHKSIKTLGHATRGSLLAARRRYGQENVLNYLPLDEAYALYKKVNNSK